jgi:hypothetical protein
MAGKALLVLERLRTLQMRLAQRAVAERIEAAAALAAMHAKGEAALVAEAAVADAESFGRWLPRAKADLQDVASRARHADADVEDARQALIACQVSLEMAAALRRQRAEAQRGRTERRNDAASKDLAARTAGHRHDSPDEAPSARRTG